MNNLLVFSVIMLLISIAILFGWRKEAINCRYEKRRQLIQSVIALAIFFSLITNIIMLTLSVMGNENFAITAYAWGIVINIICFVIFFGGYIKTKY